jgi:CBS-domain-containing membrane protein
MHVPFVILPDTPIGAALELLEHNGLYALLVVDGNDDLLGLVTREDLMADCDERPEADIDPRCVGDVMLAEVDVVGGTDVLATAFSLLMDERSPCLPFSTGVVTSLGSWQSLTSLRSRVISQVLTAGLLRTRRAGDQRAQAVSAAHLQFRQTEQPVIESMGPYPLRS